MKKSFLFLMGLAVSLLFIWVGVSYWKNYRGVWIAIAPPVENVAEIVTATSSGPFQLPPGFSVSIFAKNLPDARVIVKDQSGNFWVSQPSEGVVSLLAVGQGEVSSQRAVFRNLHRPHGLAFDPLNPSILYIAEENRISRVDISSGSPQIEKITDLPSGGEHVTRTIGFGPDDRLYVAMGSSCNVCHEADPRRAAIYSMNKDGSDFHAIATGLRNTVFFLWDKKGMMWGADMGRDYLGDNLPPDEINILSRVNSKVTSVTNSQAASATNFGWPVCYGKNVHDTDFDHNIYIRNPCMEPFETPSFIDLPAHSAPLGMAFVPEMSSWPEDYWGSLLVAFHGSWNRTTPTGYKIVRLKLTTMGEYLNSEDFMTGFLSSKGVIGRPVDLLIDSTGTLYVTDDKAGVVYRLSYKKM